MAARTPASRRFCKPPAPWTRTRTSFSAACTSSRRQCPTSTAWSIRSKINGNSMKSLPATAPGSPPSCACRRLSENTISTPGSARVWMCPSSCENLLPLQVVCRFQQLAFAIRHSIRPLNPFLLFKVPDALQHRPNDQRQRHRRIIEDLREPSAFFRRNKFSPGYGFRIRAAAKPAPMHRLRADAHAVVISLQRNFFVPAPRQQFRVHAELLRPITRHSSADRKNPHAPGGQHGVGKLLKIQERIKPQQRPLVPLAGNLVHRKVDAQFRITESGNKNGNLSLVSGFQNPSPGRRLVQILPDALVNLPAASDIFRIPCRKYVVHHLFDVVEIRFRLQRVVHPVVTGVEKFLIVHIGVVTEMRVTGGFHKPMSHERPDGDASPDRPRSDQLAKKMRHLAASRG